MFQSRRAAERFLNHLEKIGQIPPNEVEKQKALDKYYPPTFAERVQRVKKSFTEALRRFYGHNRK